MRNRICAAAALGALLSLASSSPARATTNLSGLLDGATYFAPGGLVYDEFTYAYRGDMPDASHIFVFGLDINSPGLRFQGNFEDGIGGDASESVITYRVTSRDAPITGAELEGDPYAGGENGVATVSETFGRVNEGGIGVFDLPLGSENNRQTYDSVTFDQPVQSVEVQQTIRLESISGVARVSYIDQRFPRAVPEPGSLALLGASALGLLPLVRRRRA